MNLLQNYDKVIKSFIKILLQTGTATFIFAKIMINGEDDEVI